MQETEFYSGECKKCDKAKIVINFHKVLTKDQVLKRASNRFYPICSQCVLDIIKSTIPKVILTSLQDDEKGERLTRIMKSNLNFENQIFETLDDIINPNGVETTGAKGMNDKTNNVRSMQDFRKKSTPNPAHIPVNTLTAREIYGELKKHVLGQEDYLKDLSIAAYKFWASLRDPQIKKVNLLVSGPTGTGKTQSMDLLSKIMNIPYVTFHAAQFTPSAYKGDNVWSIPEKLISITDRNDPVAIVFLDEIDKLADESSEGSETGRKVQRELLTFLEGKKMVSSKGKSGEETVEMITKNIFIVAAGSFPALERGKNKKFTRKKISMNGQEKAEDVKPFDFKDATTEDYVNFGMIPEFMGRFGMLSATKKLSVEDLVKILKTSESSPLFDQVALFKEAKVDLVFSDAFLEKIAEEAHKENIGARGLARRIENTMKEHIFDIGDYKNKVLTICADGHECSEEKEQVVLAHSA